jgi:hypothetical protein
LPILALGAADVRRTLRRYGLPFAVIGIAGAAFLAVFIVERLTPDEVFPRDNYSCIEDGLYLGGIVSEPPPGTQVVLNLCETKDPYRAEVHRWEPIRDAAPAPSLDWLRQQVEFIDQQRRAGRQVYVHCRAGFSRSGLVMAAYLMYRDGCNRDEALAALREKRSLVHPNPAFMELLLEWEQTILRSKGP